MGSPIRGLSAYELTQAPPTSDFEPQRAQCVHYSNGGARPLNKQKPAMRAVPAATRWGVLDGVPLAIKDLFLHPRGTHHRSI